jgi:lipopolysaccharide transport system permease protein
VEQAILRGLRVKSLDFRPTAPRYSALDRSEIKASLTFKERRSVSAELKVVTTPDSNPLQFPQPGSQARPLVWISPTKRWYDLDLDGIWRQRDLLLLLTLRDIKIRYRQTLLGVLWAIVQSLFPMLIFTLIFNSFMKVPTGDIPYPVFVYAGLLPWTYFSNAVSNSANSLLSNAHLVSKIYFPRLILPGAAVLSGLVDFAIGALLFVLLMVYYDLSFTWHMMFLPLLMVFTAMLALAVGTIMSALNMVYRDVGYALPRLIQLWMFLTPVIYPSRVVPQQWQWLVELNPIAGIIENFRALLFGTPVSWSHLGISAGITLVLLVCAGGLFVRMEKYLADYL